MILAVFASLRFQRESAFIAQEAIAVENMMPAC
jgi:hypothetical protein